MASSRTYIVDAKIVMEIPSVLDTFYVFDDGGQLRVETQDAYCRTCRYLRPVEKIPSVFEVESGYTDGDRRVLRKQEDTESIRFKNAAIHKRRYDWRFSRTCKPRCLKCGGHDLFILANNECRDPISGRVFAPRNCVFFDPVCDIQIRLRPDGTVISSNLEPVSFPDE